MKRSLSTMQAELDLDFSTVLVSDSEAEIEGFTCGWHVSEELQVSFLGRPDSRECSRALLPEPS